MDRDDEEREQYMRGGIRGGIRGVMRGVRGVVRGGRGMSGVEEDLILEWVQHPKKEKA